jgi:hypothetical protein
VNYQIRHYRELALRALESARENAVRRGEYQDLAAQWTELADRLEFAPQNTP